VSTDVIRANAVATSAMPDSEPCSGGEDASAIVIYKQTMKLVKSELTGKIVLAGLRKSPAFAISRSSESKETGVRIVFEEIGVFYRGLVLGLMIAAPVGPIGILCIRRTIQKGIWIGFATGLGAACADTIFSAVAALGVAAILEFMKHYDLFIRMAGGIFLILIAWHTWHDRPKQPADSVHLPGGLKAPKPVDAGFLSTVNALLSGLIITLTNPLTMFGTLAVVATFGNLQSRLDASTIVAGIFSGSTLWWLILSGGVALVRGHFTENRVITINRATAAVLTVIAVWAIASGAVGFFRMQGI
jgi:threonine/homoserine/homoserine lactone efflux protein